MTDDTRSPLGGSTCSRRWGDEDALAGLDALGEDAEDEAGERVINQGVARKRGTPSCTSSPMARQRYRSTVRTEARCIQAFSLARFALFDHAVTSATIVAGGGTPGARAGAISGLRRPPGRLRAAPRSWVLTFCARLRDLQGYDVGLGVPVGPCSRWRGHGRATSASDRCGGGRRLSSASLYAPALS